MAGQTAPLQTRRPGFSPDFGIEMWDAGFRDKPIIIYMKASSVTDYDEFRELTGFLYTDDGSYCVTVRTTQERHEIFQQIDEASHMVWVSGKLSADIDVGNSGERYRVLIGSIGIEP
jgi:hypothetical protein